VVLAILTGGLYGLLLCWGLASLVPGSSPRYPGNLWGILVPWFLPTYTISGPSSCIPSLLAIPAHRISSIVVRIHFFPIMWWVRSHVLQVLLAYIGLPGALNLILPEGLSPIPPAHPP